MYRPSTVMKKTCRNRSPPPNLSSRRTPRAAFSWTKMNSRYSFVFSSFPALPFSSVSLWHKSHRQQAFEFFDVKGKGKINANDLKTRLSAFCTSLLPLYFHRVVWGCLAQVLLNHPLWLPRGQTKTSNQGNTNSLWITKTKWTLNNCMPCWLIMSSLVLIPLQRLSRFALTPNLASYTLCDPRVLLHIASFFPPFFSPLADLRPHRFRICIDGHSFRNFFQPGIR